MTESGSRPPGYPGQWEADVLLTDGRVAHLRPIKPSDAQRLVEFYDRVSPESKYLRFFAPYPRLSQRDVQRFTEVDYVDRVAFILTLGELMIGVGRYDRIENDQAEVAFLIEDAHQGRGIAQLLLEHLAEAARERGITKFVAEVLPENRRMAQVFADAGYRVSKDVEDGLLSVEFPILPTDTSVGVMERREHRAEAASMQRLLTPERVVALGPGRRVQALVKSLLSGGFRGEVIAVSTDSVEVSGVRTSDSIATIDGSIDLLLVSIPTTDLGAVVIDAAHKRANAIVVLTGTDSEHDNRTVVSLARAYGIRALGPDALGLINTDPSVTLNASPGPMPRTGGVGIFCQSAAVGVALINRALRQNVGLSTFISSGAYSDVTGNDVMQFWQDDEHTKACLLSLETLGNPRKFSRIIRRLTRRKPVITFAPGQASRSSHVGVRGGLGHAPEQAVDALFRQAGVIVVHRRGAMFDIAKIAVRQPLPTGPRVRLIGNSATLVRQLNQTVRAVGLLPAGEPVALPGEAPAASYTEAVAAALADDECDAIVCAAVALFDSGTDEVHCALEELARESRKPLIGVLLDFDEYEDEGSDADRAGGLPTFDSPPDAIQALAALSAYAHWRERDPGAVPLLEVDDPGARRVVNRVLARDRAGRELTGSEATALLATYGIELVPRHRVSTADQAIEVAERLGWDVVLKARAAGVRGRPDLAGVHRNLETPEALRVAWSELGELTAELGLGDDPVAAEPVIQAMAPPGVALSMSSREDAAFGPMLSLGLDGIASELLGDTVYRVPPLTTADAAAMVRDLRAAPTLFGRDGRPGVDVAAVQDLLHRLAQLADDVPQLASVTLSPVIASVSGVQVLGARVLIAPTGDQRDPMARTL